MEHQVDFSSFQQKNQPVPNATAVLVLGIVSIVTCCCYGVPGLVCGIIALVLAASGKRAYALNPAQYTEGSVKNLNAGKICAIIGIILSVLFMIYMVVVISTIGWDKINDPNYLKELMEEYQRNQ